MKERTKRNMGTRRVWTIALALGILTALLGLILSACGNTESTGTTSNSTTTTQSGAMMQTNEGGQVTLQVTWQGKNAGPIFKVEMNTHAVDLDGYNMMQFAVLRTDQGQEVKPMGWDAPMGGHHRSGMLTFPAAFPDGSPVLGPNTHKIMLIIRNVAGIPERTFQWTL